MRAAYDWVIVEKTIKEKTSSGLYLPQVQNSKTVVAKVISTGIGKIEDVVEEDGDFKPMFVSPIFEVGDTVVFIDDWAFPFEVDNKTYMAIKAENIFAKLAEDKDE